MSDFTVDETMAKIIYELSDREIYNDVRAEIGTINAETVVDEDPTYEWKVFLRSSRLPAYGECVLVSIEAAHDNASSWQLYNHSAYWYLPGYGYIPYYEYDIKIDKSDSRWCIISICNTGAKAGGVSYYVKYRYKAGEGITHEEISYNTLTVRAKDDTSIAKYGRRVMNLTWPQGASENEMQMIANASLARYKEPVPVLHIMIQGKDDTLAAQIFTREISDVISVICDGLGMASTDFYLDKISIRDSAAMIPRCAWLLTGKRTEEVAGYFTIDTDFIDGDKLIG